MYRYAIEHQEPGDPRTVRTFTSWRPSAAASYADLVIACGPQLRPWFASEGDMAYIVRPDADPARVTSECQTVATLEEDWGWDRFLDEPEPGGDRGDA